MEETIYSVTEAFSMQLMTFYVGMTNNGMKVAEIKLEVVSQTLCGDHYDYKYYIGRTDEGKKVFQFKAETVNLTFK